MGFSLVDSSYVAEKYPLSLSRFLNASKVSEYCHEWLIKILCIFISYDFSEN
mgnify:CR=1 FL=1